MAELLLVRHGQASFGAADYDKLSELGVEQSRALGRWWSSCQLQVDSLMAGTMRRHRETAEGAMIALPNPPELAIDGGFDEGYLARLLGLFGSLPLAERMKCSQGLNDRAYYQQLQIRSADEPMTTFYKCTSCGLRWRED